MWGESMWAADRHGVCPYMRGRINAGIRQTANHPSGSVPTCAGVPPETDDDGLSDRPKTHSDFYCTFVARQYTRITGHWRINTNRKC